MAQCSLTLLLSAVEKLLPNDDDWPAMPALQTLLSKGRRERLPADLPSCLFDLFQLKPEPGQDRPVASLSALGDGLDVSRGWWLRADPVNLVADRDQLYLSASDALGLSRSEGEELVTELNRLYAEDGWEFSAAESGNLYLRLPQSLVMRTVPTAEAMGQRVGEVLPTGEDALAWQRAMTEMQMLLHASPVNARRAEQGLLAVNGLWFWGGGVLPEPGESDWGRVVADDPLARGLALHHGLVADNPASASLPSALGEKDVLWQQGVASAEQAERELFAPLLAMLRSGELAELMIALPGIGSWHVDRAGLRRWWRRRRPLSVLLSETVNI